MPGPSRPASALPRPVTEFVVKVHSRCDLACDHCYVYEHVDQSWRRQPKVMSAEVARATADRIAEHARHHRLSGVQVILHGGEPLLLGAAGLDATLATLRAAIDPVTRLDLRMQTNGIRLTPAIAKVLVHHDVRVGISLDGDQTANDRHRRFANGASSYQQALDAVALLRRPEFRRQYAGILCTVDLRNDPVEVYRSLAAHRPPRLDLLLPHATWESPPPRPADEPAPYARWLLAVYDEWSRDGRPMPIRLFDALRSTGAGGPSGSEWVGLDPVDLLVVETDGAFEQADTLKTAFDGAAQTGLNVFSHAVDDAAALPEVVRRTTGLADLHPTCQSCPVVRQCGGGLFAHRYREGAGFRNPSSYCADLLELIVSMNDRIAAAAHASTAVAGRSRPEADLGPDLIEQIGSGRADHSAVEVLAEAQLSIARALTAAVGDAGSAEARAGLDALAEIEQASPDAVRAVLAHPYTRVWAIGALRDADEVAARHLCNLAAAAAVRSGRQWSVPVSVRHGTAHLPTVGTISVAGNLTAMAELTVGPDGSLLRAGDQVVRLPASPKATATAFAPARWVSLGGRVLLEDLDPHRDCHDHAAAARLGPTALRSWEASLAAAWNVIEVDAAHQVAAMSSALRAVVPLRPDPAGLLRSSTARNAFGAVAVAAADSRAVAVMLVHEFQHTVLGALLDVCDLYDPDSTQRLVVAWRTDPRPVEGVLQGTFAHLAVADIWRSRAAAAGADDQTKRTTSSTATGPRRRSTRWPGPGRSPARDCGLSTAWQRPWRAGTGDPAGAVGRPAAGRPSRAGRRPALRRPPGRP